MLNMYITEDRVSSSRTQRSASGEGRTCKPSISESNTLPLSHCHVKTNVQTACTSHDLNMDFRSFDNVFK